MDQYDYCSCINHRYWCISYIGLPIYILISLLTALVLLFNYKIYYSPLLIERILQYNMKPLIATAIIGVLMILSALTVKEKKSFSVFASILLLILTCINVWELVELTHDDSAGVGMYLFNNMLHVNTVGLWFNTLMVFITLIYVLISRRQIEQVGMHVGEYY